jgi:hypothetical protein
MWHKLSAWLHKISTGPVTLAALAVFIVFTALALPAQAAEMARSTHGAGSPDTSFLYSPGDLYQLAKAYGPDGRAAYIRIRFTFDLLWPVLYTLFLATSTSWLLRRVFPPPSKPQALNLVPVLGVLFDYIENICAALVMGRYPASTPVVDVLAPVSTFLKWVFIGGSFVLLLALLGIWLWRWAGIRR